MPLIPSLSFSKGAGTALRIHSELKAPGSNSSSSGPERLDSQGELFDALLAMQPSDLASLVYQSIGSLGALITKPPTVAGNEIRVQLEDGYFFSAEEAAQAACQALGLDFNPNTADPRIARDPLMVELGTCRLRFVLPKTRTPSLRQLADKALAGKGVEAPVEAGEANLHDTAGKMAIRGRGLPVHCRDFGEAFIARLEAGAGKQLLVTGAGTSRFAHDLFFGCDRPINTLDMGRINALTQRPPEEQPRIVAVDLADPPEDTAHPSFRPETGLYKDMTTDRLLGDGPLFADVIDLMGCLTYSPTLSEDLQKTCDVMEEGGMLWVGTSDSVVIYKDGQLMLLPEWLNTIDGLDVEYRDRAPSNGNYFFFSVKKTKKDIDVEALKLIHREDKYPRAVSTIQIFTPATAN